MAATDGPLLLGGATKRAGEMAQLSQRVKESSSAPRAVKTNGVAMSEKLNGSAQIQVQEMPINGR
jgi:hypothetical protein